MAETTEARGRIWWARMLRWETALIFVLLLIAVGGDHLSGHFLTGSNMFYLGLDIGEIALISLAMTLVIVSGEIDLSVASILGMTSSLMGYLWNAGMAIEWIFPVVILAGAAAGAFNGWLVTRVGLPSLAVTIGTLGLYRGLAFVILGDQAVASFPASYTKYGSVPVPGTQIPYPMVLFAFLAIVFGIVLHATPFGRRIFAIGANQDAAYFAGIRVKRIKFTLFVLSGVMSSVAGIVWTLRFVSARGDNGTGLELAVIAAVLLGGVSIFGGRGTLLGVVFGVFILGGLRSALILDDVSADTLNVVTGALLIASVLVPQMPRALASLKRLRSAPTSLRVEPGIPQ